MSHLIFALLLFSTVASAQCLDKKGSSLSLDNESASALIRNGKDQTTERGYVKGKVKTLYKDRHGHEHFSIELDPDQTIEVVFNTSFGSPHPKVGDTVEACGDIIVTKKNTYQYLKSPDDGIIHWVHKSSGKHKDGYIKVNGQRFGDVEQEKPAPILRLDKIRGAGGIFKSADAPIGKCYKTDKRGIVLNPNYKQNKHASYGYAFDGNNLYEFYSATQKDPVFVEQTDSIKRYFRERLHRFEYDECNLTFEEIENRQIAGGELDLTKSKPNQSLFANCPCDAKGILLNPNGGKARTPYQSFYGFVIDEYGLIYKVRSASDTTAYPVNEQAGLEGFYTNVLGVDMIKACPPPGTGQTEKPKDQKAVGTP